MKKILLFILIFSVKLSIAQGLLVKDIEIGNSSSMPNYSFNRVNYNGKLIFSAKKSSASSFDVWITDGTSSETKKLKELNGTSNPHYFTYLASVDKVFFTGPPPSSSGWNYIRLWDSDGTSANTLYADNYSNFPKYLTEFNNRVYFQGRTSNTWGYELVYANGGSGTNTSTININIGSNSSYPEELKVIGNKLYFSAIANNNEGRELCISDGASTGTFRIKDINTNGADGSDPKNFTFFNNKVYFSADDGVNGRELWVTDGTAANTNIVADLNPGTDSSLDSNEPTIFIEYKDELYFTAFTASTGNELFKVNKSGNIVNVADINSGASNHSNPKDFFVFDEKLFFSADNGTDGVELWYTIVSSGTAKGNSASTTAMFKDINSQTNGSSNPEGFIIYDGKMYFNADNGVDGKELWESDGTVAGTIMKQNINPSGDSNPRDFILSGDLLYFSANDGINGDELWKYSNNFIIGALSPEDNTTDVALSGEKLKITLNKELVKGNGNIVIYKKSDDTVFETINISGNNVTINNNKVTITPTLDFIAIEEYYVLIDNGALKDTSNNNFIGISDKTIWNFKTIGTQNQTITFNTLSNKTFGDSDFQLTATASSNLPISYTSSNVNVATINGNTVTIVGAGTTTITASQTGNANYNAAQDVTQTLTVDKANQTITFNTLSNKTFNDSDFQLSATSSSGLTVAYVSSNTNVATINGNMVTIVGAGTTTITASQSGNTNYNAAQGVAQALTIDKANQTITFVINFPNRQYNDADRTLTATSDSGLPVTYTSSDPNVVSISGNVASFVGVGNGINITASQSGNTNYNAAANVVQTYNVAKASQVLTFNPPATATFGDPNFTLTASSNSGIAMQFFSFDTDVVSISGNQAEIIGAGSTTLQASNTGNSLYEAASSLKTFTVFKASQNITFNQLPDVDVNDPDFNLTATSDSGLAISYSSSNPNVASVSGSLVSIHTVGVTTITASQPGNDNYNGASDETQSLTVTNTASIDSFEKLGLEIYPNPTSSEFIIQTELVINKLQIYNLLGQKLKEYLNPKTNNFSLKNLVKGVYIINIYTEKGIGSSRIIKVE